MKQNLKGFRDFLGSDAIKRDWLKNKIKEIFEIWGYDPLETPTLEPLDIFKGVVGEDEKLFFKFKDQGGREVALRYDQTVPTARVIGQYRERIHLPYKRYQIQSAFRSEKPQKGRYREFTQCDADIFGVLGPSADAELITLSLDIFKRLGFKNYKVLINDRSLLKDIPYTALVAIDKLRKTSAESVIKEMVNKGITEVKAKEYLNYVKNLKPNETIKFILKFLKDYGFTENCFSFEQTIVRSFAYSTGPIWEVEISGFQGGSVLGGERFDKLIEKVSGITIPGTGFGLGFDRTLEAAEQFNLIPNVKTKTNILVTVFSNETLSFSLNTALKIRETGVNVDIYPDTVRLDKQLKYADYKGCKYAIIIGPDEIKRNVITVKDLILKTQETLTLNEFIEKINAD